MAKIVCPGCGAEIDTESGQAVFPPNGDDADGGQPQGDGDGSEPSEPVTPAPVPQKPRSRFIR